MKFNCLVLAVCGCVFFLTICTKDTALAQSATVSEKPVLSWWTFEKGGNHFVVDTIQQKKDSVFGNFEYVPGIAGTALKLDGFRTYIRRNATSSAGMDGAFTLETWIALAGYPWDWSPVMDCSYAEMRGFFWGIDQEGHVRFRIAAGSSWQEATTEKKIPLREWTHLAAVFVPDSMISLYMNGELVASARIRGRYIPSRSGTLTIGRNNTAQNWNEFQLTTKNTYFFLDGLLDELKITSGAKSKAGILNDFNTVQKRPVPALSRRDHLPAGPAGSGNFGAFYTKLDYYKEWDDMWRVSDVPDLFVRFDQSPAQLVFWRGASFVPCWVTENGIWYTNEWLETWGKDVVSCAEPIMDRDCRFSHVRLIENSEARVVIHWRYALSDAFYNFVAIGDDGRGEWCDEFHTIYPDMVGVRKMELHYSKPERKHDWEEQIVVLPPGKYPDDVIEKDAISLINMQGEVHHYSWHDKDLKVEMTEPKGANMSFVNLKSKYRPFFIVSPDPVETIEGKWNSPFFRTYASKMAGGGYRQDPVPSVYGWWNHWPVAQVPGDGRWVTTPDRPSHFNLTTFVQWKDYAYNSHTRTRIMLQGMTDQAAAQLVPLAKSWLQAPKMEITSDKFSGGQYDESERAYLAERIKPGQTDSFTFKLNASANSPVLNPALIVKNWGNQPATLSIDGQNCLPGKNFRQSIRKGPLGDDLIIWLRMEKEKPVSISVKPVPNSH